VDQKTNPAYPGFYNGGVHVVGAWPEGLGDVSPPMGTRGKAPVGVQGTQKLKNNVKLVYNFERFTEENFGFNEYISRAWTVGQYFANN